MISFSKLTIGAVLLCSTNFCHAACDTSTEIVGEIAKPNKLELKLPRTVVQLYRLSDVTCTKVANFLKVKYGMEEDYTFLPTATHSTQSTINGVKVNKAEGLLLHLTSKDSLECARLSYSGKSYLIYIDSKTGWQLDVVKTKPQSEKLCIQFNGEAVRHLKEAFEQGEVRAWKINPFKKSNKLDEKQAQELEKEVSSLDGAKFTYNEITEVWKFKSYTLEFFEATKTTARCFELKYHKTYIALCLADGVIGKKRFVKPDHTKWEHHSAHRTGIDASRAFLRALQRPVNQSSELARRRLAKILRRGM